MFTYPINEFVGLRQAMNPYFQANAFGGPYRTLWSRPGNRAAATPAWPLPLNVYATGDEVVIVAAAPGLHPENLDISYHQGTVVLSGRVANVADGEQAKAATWYAQELWSGTFRRAVALPFEVDADNAQATWEHGIVRITLPKAETAKPKRISVQVGNRTEAIAAGDSTS